MRSFKKQSLEFPRVLFWEVNRSPHDNYQHILQFLFCRFSPAYCTLYRNLYKARRWRVGQSLAELSPWKVLFGTTVALGIFFCGPSKWEGMMVTIAPNPRIHCYHQQCCLEKGPYQLGPIPSWYTEGTCQVIWGAQAFGFCCLALAQRSAGFICLLL